MNMFSAADHNFPWLAGAMLAFESFEVINLRLAKLAIGDHDADDEARLMVNEKIDAMFQRGDRDRPLSRACRGQREAAFDRLTQDDPRRRMVAGALFAAHLAVDAGLDQARRQCR